MDRLSVLRNRNRTQFVNARNRSNALHHGNVSALENDRTEQAKIKMEKNTVIGAEDVLRELKKIEPNLYKEVQTQIINDLRPLYDKIKSSIPPIAPLTGFNHQGRTGWGKPTKVVGKISLRKRVGKRSLVSVRTTNAAVQIADLAGRGHTPSGKKMVENLPGAASRYVFPAVEKYIPTLNRDIIKIVEKYSQELNIELAKYPDGA